MERLTKTLAVLVLLGGVLIIGDWARGQQRGRTGGGIVPPSTTLPYLSPPSTRNAQP